MKWRGREESKNVEVRSNGPGRNGRTEIIGRRPAETDQGVSEMANKMIERALATERDDYKKRSEEEATYNRKLERIK